MKVAMDLCIKRAGKPIIGIDSMPRTKDDVCDLVGLTFLDWVVANIALPFVAIGGIKLHNIEQIVQRGQKKSAW